jgi:hypothetical protein
MVTPQARHRPLRARKERTGTLSQAAMSVPQDGQWLPGQATDRPWGQRQITTLAKLPQIEPKRPAKTNQRALGKMSSKVIERSDLSSYR